MKKVELHNPEEVEDYLEMLQDSANEAQMKIMDYSGNHDGMMLLQKMKFEEFGFDPLNPERNLNLIEQINQTFTYLSSFKAVELLFDWYPDLSKLSLNLGTASGTDIESPEYDGIAAEIFSATRPNSNNKLNKDIDKVSSVNAKHKYVFFLCPSIEPGEYNIKKETEVTLWSLEL